jgi:hypothetical protein
MRMIMHVSFPVDSFNAAVRDGSIGGTIQKILADQKPEAVYFTEWNSQRSALLVVDVKDASKIPAFAEPWFLKFNASIALHPVMSPADLGAAGLDELGKKWG